MKPEDKVRQTLYGLIIEGSVGSDKDLTQIIDSMRLPEVRRSIVDFFRLIN